MSAKKFNKNEISFNNNNNNDYNYRESFDRICDDLCELIVSYLLFEDKIRFECVSKQFQRLVYNKQNSIKINEKYFFFFKTKISIQRLLFDNQISGKFDYKAFESLLKKCKFITKISIDSHFESGDHLIELIARYCPHLKSIKFDFSSVSQKSMIDFGLNCGQKLETIEFLSPEQSGETIKSLLKLCPNLLTLINIKAFDSLDSLVPKLTKVKNLFLTEGKFMDILVNKYQNSLKSFEINIIENNININESKQKLLLRQISSFKSLQELYLMFICFESTPDLIKSIALKCKNLNILGLDVRYDSSLSLKLFESIGYFENLKSLTLIGFDGKFNIKSLKKCKQLLFLKLDYFDDEFFDSIETITPLLSHLVLGRFGQISDKAFHSLAKLKILKFLEINTWTYFARLTDIGFCDLIENSLELKSIQINERPNITQTTIKALISLALRKPRTNFNHNLGTSHIYVCHFDHSNYTIERVFKSFNEILPKNLSIHFCLNYEFAKVFDPF
jgi:hypothetical protein